MKTMQGNFRWMCEIRRGSELLEELSQNRRSDHPNSFGFAFEHFYHEATTEPFAGMHMRVESPTGEVRETVVEQIELDDGPCLIRPRAHVVISRPYPTAPGVGNGVAETSSNASPRSIMASSLCSLVRDYLNGEFVLHLDERGLVVSTRWPPQEPIAVIHFDQRPHVEVLTPVAPWFRDHPVAPKAKQQARFGPAVDE